MLFYYKSITAHFFRVVPKFLVQFGISYIKDDEIQKLSKQQIPDDPSKGMKFNKGTISFAGKKKTSIQFFKNQHDGEILSYLSHLRISQEMDQTAEHRTSLSPMVRTNPLGHSFGYETTT